MRQSRRRIYAFHACKISVQHRRGRTITTTYNENDDDIYDEREAAEVRAEEQALYGDPFQECAYDPDADDITFDD